MCEMTFELQTVVWLKNVHLKMLGYLLVTHPVCLFFAVQVCWLEPPRLEQSSSTLQREGLYSTVHGAPAEPTATPSNLTLKVSLMTDIYTLGFISAKEVLCSFLALQFKRKPFPRGLDAANQFIHSLKQTIFFCLFFSLYVKFILFNHEVWSEDVLCFQSQSWSCFSLT